MPTIDIKTITRAMESMGFSFINFSYAHNDDDTSERFIVSAQLYTPQPRYSIEVDLTNNKFVGNELTVHILHKADSVRVKAKNKRW